VTRSLLLAVILLLQQLPPAATPDGSSFFHFQRSVHAAAPGQACAALDAPTLSHAAPFLRDLRLFAGDPTGAHEIPFVLTLSEAQQAESEPAHILNLGMHGHAVEFDLAMPARPYTEVDLDLAGKDFLATAAVSGAASGAAVSGTGAPAAPHPTRLGDFNLFDLTSQHLSRSTSLYLGESSFPFLHISLTASPAAGGTFVATPGMVRGASVPPSREAQTLFTVAAQTSTLEQRGQATVARFHLPPKVPIERVAFVLKPGFHANFSRDVHVSSHAPGAPSTSGDSVTGTIQRVKLFERGREISQEQLAIPATLGANLQDPAEVEVEVDNGNEPPLPISSVQLDMRQRDLCFQTVAGQQLTLLYGDPELSAPVYDLARTYTPSARSATAQLGPEDLNPAWRPRRDHRAYTERHPHLLWIALLIVVGSLAFVAFHHPHTRLH